MDTARRTSKLDEMDDEQVLAFVRSDAWAAYRASLRGPLSEGEQRTLKHYFTVTGLLDPDGSLRGSRLEKIRRMTVEQLSRLPSDEWSRLCSYVRERREAETANTTAETL